MDHSKGSWGKISFSGWPSATNQTNQSGSVPTPPQSKRGASSLSTNPNNTLSFGRSANLFPIPESEGTFSQTWKSPSEPRAYAQPQTATPVFPCATPKLDPKNPFANQAFDPAQTGPTSVFATANTNGPGYLFPIGSVGTLAGAKTNGSGSLFPTSGSFRPASNQPLNNNEGLSTPFDGIKPNKPTFVFKESGISASSGPAKSSLFQTCAIKTEAAAKPNPPTFVFKDTVTNAAFSPSQSAIQSTVAGSPSASGTVSASFAVLTTDVPPHALERIELPFHEFMAEPISDLNRASESLASSPSRKIFHTADDWTKVESLLTGAYHAFRLANDRCLHLSGDPSAIALYNMACVLSLTVELQVSVAQKESVSQMLECYGDRPVGKLVKAGHYMCPRIPPLALAAGPVSGTMTLRQVTERRLLACDRCLKAAVAAGWTDLKHLASDRDLQEYRDAMDTSWIR